MTITGSSIPRERAIRHPDHMLRPDQWWACDYPERPSDHRTCWKSECPACLIHMKATALSDPKIGVTRMATGETHRIGVLITELVRPNDD